MNIIATPPTASYILFKRSDVPSNGPTRVRPCANTRIKSMYMVREP